MHVSSIDWEDVFLIPFARMGRDVVGGEALRHFLDRELFFGRGSHGRGVCFTERSRKASARRVARISAEATPRSITCRSADHRALFAAQSIPAGLDGFGAGDCLLDLEIERIAARADFGR